MKFFYIIMGILFFSSISFFNNVGQSDTIVQTQNKRFKSIKQGSFEQPSKRTVYPTLKGFTTDINKAAEIVINFPQQIASILHMGTRNSSMILTLQLCKSLGFGGLNGSIGGTIHYLMTPNGGGRTLRCNQNQCFVKCPFQWARRDPKSGLGLRIDEQSPVYYISN